MCALAIAFVIVATTLTPTVFAADAKTFTINPGERVVFLGGTYVERDQQFGYFESLLTAKFENFTFRNVAWSGDTVKGHARAVFGSVEDGFKAMLKQVNDAKPNVLLVNYGMNESFEGEAGLGDFKASLERVLIELEKTKARIVIVSPFKHQKLPPPLPDPTEHNKSLSLYVDALRYTADKRGYQFVDLFSADIPGLETENGIHPNPQGYWAVSVALVKRLGIELPASLESVKVKVGGIPPGVLPDSLAALEKLRTVINDKNAQFFYRWRPQNETYIYLFRKGEQGRNAVEIPKFDPIVEAKEKEIAGLRSAAAALVK